LNNLPKQKNNTLKFETMKKTIGLMIVGLFACSVLIMSCGGKKESTTEEKSQAKSDSSSQQMKQDSTQMTYACPMHPEVIGKEGDKCSKCGMKLEKK
jgi:hypothetical protein